MAHFATFWTGSIDALERACLASFAQRAHQITLYSFERREPSALYDVRPAAEILDQGYIERFITDGRPNVAHFSDAFRLSLFARTEAIWIDCDLLLARDLTLDLTGNIFVREGRRTIIAALLRIADRRIADHALAMILAQADKDLPWAATQNIIPKAISTAENHSHLLEPRLYNPVAADDFHKLLLPEHRAECDALCREAETIHLYNNILQKIGFYKNLLPPEGSALHALLKPFAAEAGFIGTYPAPVVRAMVEGWRSRFDGTDLGIGAVIRRVGPGLRTTARRRLWA